MRRVTTCERSPEAWVGQPRQRGRGLWLHCVAVGTAALALACGESKDPAPATDSGSGLDGSPLVMDSATGETEAPDAAGTGYGCVGAAGPGGRPRICNVAHMAFRVTDLAKARAFYGTYLGFAEPFAVSDTIAVFKINDNQYIELYQEVPAPGDLNYQLKKMGFYTSDAEGLRAHYASKGVMVPAAVSKNPLGNTSFIINDQDDHPMEWVQYEPDSLTGRTQGQAMPSALQVRSIHHIGATIGDSAKAHAFYEKSLGLVAARTADKDAAMAPEGTDRIEYGIFHASPKKEFAVSRDHLCLRVDSTIDTIAALRARDPNFPIEHHPLVLIKEPVASVTVRANVVDPDGTRIEIADSILETKGEKPGPGDPPPGTSYDAGPVGDGG